MSGEPVKPPVEPPVYGLKAATVLGAVFVILYALFAALGSADRENRSRLETVELQPLSGKTVFTSKP